MADIGNMKLSVGMDINDLLNGMQRAGKSLTDFQAQLGRFKSSLATSTDPASILRLNRAIASAQSKIKAIGSAGSGGGGMESLAKGTNSANAALTDFGRIAQDASFGPIAISNNIVPLVESFGRLKAETGSGVGALKALGSSMLGGGGLIFAFSAVTAAIGFAQMGLSAWTRGFGDNAKQIDEAKKAQEDYKQSVKSIFESTAQEVVEVQSLIAVLQSETATRDKKLATITQLQKLNPEIFGGLKIEGGLVSGLDAAYKAYIDNIKTVIAVKIKQQQLEKITQAILEKEGATLTTSAKTLKDAIEKTNKARREGNKDALDPLSLKQDQDQVKANKELNGLYADQKGIIQDISQLQAGVKVDPIKTGGIPSAKDVKETKNFSNVIKELRENVKSIGIDFDFGDISAKEKDVNVIRAYIDAFKELTSLNAGAAPLKITELEVEIKPERIRTQLDEAIREGTQTLGARNLSAPAAIVNIPIDLKPLTTDFPTFTKELIDMTTEVQGIISNTLNSGLAEVGKGIADVITGDGSVGSAFKSLLNIVAEGVIALGQAMIAAGTAKEVLEKFQVTPGITTILAGIGTVAIGNVLKNAIPKFAAGGIVTGPTVGLLGEAGPEVIMPLDKLKNIVGGGQMAFIADTQIRGNDIWVSYQRTDRQRGRNG